MEDKSRPLRVLFLSDDTGGGHRASAEALGRQFQLHFPKSEYEIVNLWTDHGDLFLRSLCKNYKHMSASPWQWKFVYHVSNNRVMEKMVNDHARLLCGQAIKKRIESFDPDVVVSVHPTMNLVPRMQTQRISEELRKHIPFFTVVTDLGSAHSSWFRKEVDGIYVASEKLFQEAVLNKGVDSKIIQRTGLPIRHEFSVQAENLQDRTTEHGKVYQAKVRELLDLEADKPMVLVMGGGEGVGSLSEIVNHMYIQLTLQGTDATICVVCGRNEALAKNLKTRDWATVLEEYVNRRRRRHHGLFGGQMMMIKNNFSKERNETTNLQQNNNEDEINDESRNDTEEFQGDDQEGEGDDDDYDGRDETKTAEQQAKTNSPLMEKWFHHGKKHKSSEEDQARSWKRPIVNPGIVNVVGLGFVSNMPEYMVAADILVTKAGPGTIAEAASVGLPVMLTSFLPGQEAGNVDIVVDAGFGDYNEDPVIISKTVGSWLQDSDRMKVLSLASQKVGHPNAAADIAKSIGNKTIEILMKSSMTNHQDAKGLKDMTIDLDNMFGPISV